jgi:hypothetical protein
VTSQRAAEDRGGFLLYYRITTSCFFGKHFDLETVDAVGVAHVFQYPAGELTVFLTAGHPALYSAHAWISRRWAENEDIALKSSILRQI